MRSIRRFSQILLTLLGSALVIYAVYRVDVMYQRVIIAAVGLLVMELGIWQVTHMLFPNEREFKPLRDETEYFLTLVRRMNREAMKGQYEAARELDQVQSEMYESVERMRRLAGRTEEELGLSPVVSDAGKKIA